jgi:hypothetical protein
MMHPDTLAERASEQPVRMVLLANPSHGVRQVRLRNAEPTLQERVRDVAHALWRTAKYERRVMQVLAELHEPLDIIVAGVNAVQLGYDGLVVRLDEPARYS